jgi:hypothetical protein
MAPLSRSTTFVFSQHIGPSGRCSARNASSPSAPTRIPNWLPVLAVKQPEQPIGTLTWAAQVPGKCVPKRRPRLYSERVREAREFLWSRTIRNGAARCSDVLGVGLRSGFRPLRSYFSYRQFLVIDLVDSSGDRLANLGDRDPARCRANSRITLDVYTQAVSSHKRAARSRIVKTMVSDLGTKTNERHAGTAG